MRHTTEIEITNLKDLFLAEAGGIPAADVRPHDNAWIEEQLYG